ncbi:VOC family protein [Chryseolinea sp. T2]|uniref:VOC family protein n=1 Tax=Chryseolinea sp. T2 TaxID=3129255 RepID=UPI003077BA14
MAESIYPCLWFDNQARAAAEFYCSVFNNSRILSEHPVVVMFELNGSKFMGLNGGPIHKPTHATSFVIPCDTQNEIDSYWQKLSENGGREEQCGWVRDKFGYSWQIVPSILGELMSEPAKAERVMNKILKMNKLDIEQLKNA